MRGERGPVSALNCIVRPGLRPRSQWQIRAAAPFAGALSSIAYFPCNQVKPIPLMVRQISSRRRRAHANRRRATGMARRQSIHGTDDSLVSYESGADSVDRYTESIVNCIDTPVVRNPPESVRVTGRQDWTSTERCGLENGRTNWVNAVFSGLQYGIGTMQTGWLSARPMTVSLCVALDGAPRPQETFRNNSASCITWSQCAGGSEAVFCTIEGGKHYWPGL